MGAYEIHMAALDEIEKWAERFNECRFNMGMNHDQMKAHFTKKYKMSADDYEELCEKVDAFLDGRDCTYE
tara:strand:- start:772 stop:981 length:210 start_codon:yes stop_codon:yes gene_type:complete